MKKILAAITALSFVFLTGCSAQERPENVVDVFNYADIKEQVSVVSTADDSVVDGGGTFFEFPTSLPEVDTFRRSIFSQTEDTDLYGVVLVVETKQSENILKFHQGDQTELLQKDRIYENVEGGLHLSYVKNTAVIREVLYQPEDSDLKAGDTIPLGEPYYILDDRVPNVQERVDSKKLQLHYGGTGEWVPMESGETYIIFGYYWSRMEHNYDDSYRLRGHVWGDDYGIYCLSDPTKQAGIRKDDKTFAEGVAYLKANYDLAKYGLK